MKTLFICFLLLASATAQQLVNIYPQYDAAATYGAGEMVMVGTLTYASLQSSNSGHAPVSSPSYWTQLAGFVPQIRPVLILRGTLGVTPQINVVTTSLTSGTTVNLSAGSPLGWVFYGQDSAAHDINGNSPDCTAVTLNNTQTPCTPGAAKLGGSGITPLYVTIPSGDNRIYFPYGPTMPSLGWSWTDSSGYSATGNSSKLYQVPNAASTMQVAIESDPILKEATIYVNDWSGNASGGCNSGAGTLHVTFHFTDSSVADQTVNATSVEGNCSGAFKFVVTFASAASSYMTVTTDQSSSGGGASLMAASLRIP